MTVLQSITAGTIAGLALVGVGHALMRRLTRASRERQRAWEEAPSLYDLDELRRMYHEWRELDEAGLLDEGQPTPWSHAIHAAMTKGSAKDRVLLRMAFSEFEP